MISDFSRPAGKSILKATVFICLMTENGPIKRGRSFLELPFFRTIFLVLKSTLSPKLNVTSRLDSSSFLYCLAETYLAELDFSFRHNPLCRSKKRLKKFSCTYEKIIFSTWVHLPHFHFAILTYNP